MPEPVAVVVNDCAIFWAGSGPIAPLCKRTGAKVGSQLITTAQAEAYAQAKVDEAVTVALIALRRSLYGELEAFERRGIIEDVKKAICALKEQS